MIELKVFFGDKEEATRVFSPQQLPILIGRQSDADIHIDNTMVSRRHAILDILGNKFVLADQDSDNGFRINDQPQARVAVLQDGDQVHIGKHRIHVGISLIKNLEDSERRFQPRGGEPIESTVKMEKTRAGSASGEVVHKLMINKPTGRSCPLHSLHTWIGSGEGNDIVVRGFGIAERHLLVYWDGERHHAIDLTGKKKAKVNDQGIEDVALNPGDHIALGALEMDYK